MACDTNGHPVAFLDSFDPHWGAANSANYLGDAGSSEAGSFSFPVSAGDTFILVFMNTSSKQSCSYSYSFTYDAAVAAPEPAPSLGCTLPIPEGSVVGDAPFQTQVYYEPGKAAPGVMLNPGTYIVTGQDESETYYQIVLACKLVWVSKAMMQPSYQAPQNGAALPTRVVQPVTGGASGSANDLLPG